MKALSQSLGIQLTILVLALLAIGFMASPGIAATAELDKALSQSFQERAEVVKKYEMNGVSGPQESVHREKGGSPITVEVGDVLDRGSDEASGVHTSRAGSPYRETNIARKLDRELDEIDRSVTETIRDSQHSGHNRRVKAED